MALNFPDNPTTNDYFTDNTSGFTYQWNGTAWISVGSTGTTQIKELDDIASSFDDSTQTFSLTIGGSAVYPFSANQITIILGGILQNAGDDFTISGDQITFTTPPTTGLTFAGMFYGSSVSMNTATAGSIGTAALSTGGPVWNTGGDVTVAGIVTVGSSSVVIDGPSNELRVGTGATINESGIVIGIITATTFYGDGSNISNVTSGIGTADSVNTTGIVTASYFYGSGIGLTNIGGPIHAIAYSPGIGATGIGATSNIVVTFNKPLKINSGTITLKEGAADGTTIESYDVATTDRITISGGQITIDPTDDLSLSTSYYVAFPAGAYKDILDTASTAGISTYSFETAGGSTSTYELWGWGSNSNGELAQGDLINYSSPTQIPGTQWTSYSAGQANGSHLALKSDGTMWVWGYNSNGKLGQNEPTNVGYSSPVQIPGTQWSGGISARFSCAATKTDGTLWVWGNGGDLPLNDGAGSRSSPHQVPGTQWEGSFGAGREQIYVIKTDGTLWSWGYNAGGTLGLNDISARSSPHQIPGTQWVYIHGGYSKSMGTKTDGTLWVFGSNYSYGHLGQNNTNDYSSPIQIPGTQWNYITSTAYTSLAMKTDGTLWSFGNNQSGEGGQNNKIRYSSPRQIPGTQWSAIEGSRYHVKALKSDGTLWVWGNNYSGDLGLGDIQSRSSPVQVPGTRWSFDRVGISTGSPVGQYASFVFKTP